MAFYSAKSLSTIFWGTTFVFCSVFGTFSQEVEVADVVAGYNQNVDHFFKSRILYSFSGTDRFTGSEVNKIADTLVPPIVTLYDYWTDERSYLIRGGEYVKSGVDNSVLMSFTHDNFNSDDMQTTYKHIPIMSYCDQDGIGRLWDGYSKKYSPALNDKSEEKASVQLGKKIFFGMNPNAPSLPPLLRLSSYDKHVLHPIDKFFALPIDNMFIVGRHQVNGVDCIVMENRTMLPKNYINYGDDIFIGTRFEKTDRQTCHLFTAWIDPQKGFLPIRLEEKIVVTVDGKLIRNENLISIPGRECTSSFEILETKEVTSGAFYPIKSLYQYWITDPAITLPKISSLIIGKFEGKEYNFPQVVLIEYKWDIHNIRPNTNISLDTLKMPYPNGTILYDMDTKQESLVGLTQKEYEAQLKSEEKKLRTQYDRDSGYVLPDPNAKHKIEDYIPKAPVGYRRAFFIIGVNLIILSLLVRHFFIRWKKYKNNKNNQSKK